MIYLDYSATTPVNREVLDSFNKASLDFLGNSNSVIYIRKQTLAPWYTYDYCILIIIIPQSSLVCFRHFFSSNFVFFLYFAKISTRISFPIFSFSLYSIYDWYSVFLLYLKAPFPSFPPWKEHVLQ